MFQNKKVSFLLLFCIVFFFVVYLMLSGKEHRLEEYQQEQLKSFEAGILQEAETSQRLMEFLFNLILKDEFIQKSLYSFYGASSDTQNKIREDVYKHILPTYEEFSKISFKQIHIHLKDNRSFLRMHNKEMYGDDLSQLRPMIRYVNENKIRLNGFEIGRMVDGYRYIQPLFYHDEHVGSIEYVLSSQYQIKQVKQSATSQIAFIVKKDKTFVKVDKKYQNEYVKVDNLNGYLMTNTLYNQNKLMIDTIKSLTSQDVEFINHKLSIQKSFNITIQQGTRYTLLQFVPQKLALSDEIAGYYVYFGEALYMNEVDRDFRIMIIVAYIILSLMFYFLYHQSTTKELLKTKNDELEGSWKIVDRYVIFSTTDLHGVITSVSSAFCDISGYTKEELIGHSHRIVRHPDTPKEYFKQLWEALHNNKTWVGLVKNKTKTGEKYWIKTFIEPLYDKQGKKIGYKNIAVDVSDSKTLEKVNKNLKKKIKRAVKLNIAQYKRRQDEQLQNIKLTSIGTLAAGITHEINTPLTYMKGNLEMMKYDIIDLENNESLKQMLLSNHQKVRDGIIRISNIVEAMRELASTTKDDVKVEMNVYNSLLTALIMVYSKSKHTTKIYINGALFDINMDHSAGCDCMVYAHQQRLEQVWIVIVNNAIDELIKMEDYEERKLSINLEQDEEKVIVYFKDNAGGISEDILGNLFDPFVSTKESGGMGIGLNIAKKIIESNNGILEAYNEDGGAVFKVTLSKKLPENS